MNAASSSSLGRRNVTFMSEREPASAWPAVEAVAVVDRVVEQRRLLAVAACLLGEPADLVAEPAGHEHRRRRSRTPAACCTSIRARRTCGSPASSASRRAPEPAASSRMITIVTPGRAGVLLRAGVDQRRSVAHVDRPRQEVRRHVGDQRHVARALRGRSATRTPCDRLVRRDVQCTPGRPSTLAARRRSGTRRNPRPAPSTRLRIGPAVAASFAAFVPHDPVITYSAARVRAAEEVHRHHRELLCRSALAEHDAVGRRDRAASRRFASASPITSSNHGLRCEISSGETPTPGQRDQVAPGLLEHRLAAAWPARRRS